jgi:hypothetical protein
MSEAAPPQSPTVSAEAAPRPALPRALVLAAMAVLLVFIVTQGLTLWNEYFVLRGEMSTVRANAIIGYEGVSPRFSFAQPPKKWFRQEGEYALFWGGWQERTGHRWFRVGLGDVDPSRVTEPIGSDVLQAIDYPVVESIGGLIWGRIPDEAPVVGSRLAGIHTVYPMLILEKVLAVNDTIGERPFLIISNPLAPRDERTAVYDPILDGHRLTMGLSGYFHDRKPLLYDRGTESLWVADGEALHAIAGKHKGKRLLQIARPAAVSWSHWRSQHPDSRLVVGADRSKSRPEL